MCLRKPNSYQHSLERTALEAVVYECGVWRDDLELLFCFQHKRNIQHTARSNAQGDCSHQVNERTARLQNAPARPAGATPLALIKVMFSQKIARLATRCKHGILMLIRLQKDSLEHIDANLPFAPGVSSSVDVTSHFVTPRKNVVP